MGKGLYSTVEKKSESRIPHLFLAAVALLGFGFLIIGLAGVAYSAPSGYGNPAIMGHNPADIEGGSFFEDLSDSTKNRWLIPGDVGIKGGLLVGSITGPAFPPAFPLHIISTSMAQVLRLESAAAGGTQIGLLNTADAQEWRIGTGISDDDEFTIRDQTATVDRLTIEANGEIGIGTKDPTQSLDVSGQIHASTDVCIGTSATGKCLSDLGEGGIYVTPAKLSVQCNNGCKMSDAGNIDSLGIENTLTVACPAGQIPLSCGGGIKIETPAGVTVRGSSVTPEYTSTYATVGNPQNGCTLYYELSGVPTDLRGFVKAVCIPAYT